MEVLYERCCGLDVHKKTVVACVMITFPNGHVQKSVRTFGTTTAELLELCDWIDGQHVSHLATDQHGNFLAPALQSLRGRTHHYSRECSSHEVGSWPENRWQGPRMDR